MTNGWRGGEYSLFRGMLAAAVVVHTVLVFPEVTDRPDRTFPSMALALGAVLSPLLAAGVAARVIAAAMALSLLLVALDLPFPGLGRLSLASVLGPLALKPGFLPMLVLLQVFVRPAPFGSWAARGRLDPAGGWRLPPEVVFAAQVLLALWLGLLLWFGLRGHDAPLVPLSAVPGILMLAVFAAGPGWVRRAADGAPPDVIFYDGTCGVCHRAVRFIIAEDTGGQTFRFAPLQSPAFERLVPEVERARLPDSMVVLTGHGRMMLRSGATLRIYARLGGFWRVLGGVLWLVPRPLRDLGYDVVARVRKRIFPAPKETCPILPPDLRQRFLT